jgi:hypothetical protein
MSNATNHRTRSHRALLHTPHCHDLPRPENLQDPLKILGAGTGGGRGVKISSLIRCLQLELNAFGDRPYCLR